MELEFRMNDSDYAWLEELQENYIQALRHEKGKLHILYSYSKDLANIDTEDAVGSLVFEKNEKGIKVRASQLATEFLEALSKHHNFFDTVEQVQPIKFNRCKVALSEYDTGGLRVGVFFCEAYLHVYTQISPSAPLQVAHNIAL